METSHDKLYEILLDVQKQIGLVSRETGEQTKKLDALNEKVGIQNGRVTATEKKIAELREFKKYILGGFAVLSFLGGYIIYSFKRDIVEQTSNMVVTILEQKYNLTVE